MSLYYSQQELPSKYSSTPNDTSPYSLPTSMQSDNPGIMAAPAMFPRFPPYDRLDIQQLPKPGYEPENITATEAFMRSYGSANPNSQYSPPDRIQGAHPAAHRGFGGAYPPAPAMPGTNSQGLPIFPWMRSNISGE